MKIEKLNENKIRITFNSLYLKKNNMDVHSFMSNSIESQSLFLNMLDEAEKEVGFITDNYKLSVEAIALTNGTFILTITRIEKEPHKSSRVQVHRKTQYSYINSLIYKFESFDDFCNLENFLTTSLPQYINYFAKSNLLYKYNDIYFLIIENIDENYIEKISSIFSEFATSIQYSDILVQKIKECGLLIRNVYI